MTTKHRTDGAPPRRSRWRASLCSATVLIGLLASATAMALPDDRDQPIRITADTAIRDEKKSVTIYTGNVHMIQGSMDIVADEITIYHATAQADKIVAKGKPAKLKQKPAVDEPLVRAHANTIEYYRNEDRVHLQSNAQITQDGASVDGDSIDYFIVEQLVKANSAKSTDGKRVQVVIPPQVVREEDNASEPNQPKETPSGATESN